MRPAPARLLMQHARSRVIQRCSNGSSSRIIMFIFLFCYKESPERRGEREHHLPFPASSTWAHKTQSACAHLTSRASLRVCGLRIHAARDDVSHGCVRNCVDGCVMLKGLDVGGSLVEGKRERKGGEKRGEKEIVMTLLVRGGLSCDPRKRKLKGAQL